jgi:hypothetical protein
MENWRRAYASQTVVTCAVLGIYCGYKAQRQFLNHHGGLFWSRSHGRNVEAHRLRNFLLTSFLPIVAIPETPELTRPHHLDPKA